MNMVEATAREIARVAELVPLATEIVPDHIPTIREIVREACVALGRGDAIEVIRAYQALRAIGNACTAEATS